MKSWSWSRTFGLGLGLEEKVLQFFKTFVVILDGREQGTPYYGVNPLDRNSWRTSVRRCQVLPTPESGTTAAP